MAATAGARQVGRSAESNGVRRRQPKLHVIRTEADPDDPDEFAASVERDLAQLPTTKDPDRR